MTIQHNQHSRFLFTGDSLTASGRSDDPEGVGFGYVRLIRDYLYARYTQTAPLVLNRAIAIKSILDLDARWHDDVIELRPDVLSILINIRETGTPSETVIPLEEFRVFYRQLLARTSDALPKCRIILGEPIAPWIQLDTGADEMLASYRQALFELQREFNAEAFVPLNSGLAWARRIRPDVKWFNDVGVPSSAGQMLIANTWLEETGLSARLR